MVFSSHFQRINIKGARGAPLTHLDGSLPGSLGEPFPTDARAAPHGGPDHGAKEGPEGRGPLQTQPSGTYF